METPAAALLFEERSTRSPQALALELIAARAIIDALLENMADLKAHIKDITPTNARYSELCRAAGGIAAVDLLDRWVIDALMNLNGVAEAAAAEWPAD